MTTEGAVDNLSKNWRSILLILVIIGGASGGLLGAYYVGLFNPRQVPPSIHFTITESNQGFNDSAYHSGTWPVMNVVLGQSVTILVENNDTVATHGFVITRYFDAGVQLRPGETHKVTFVANQTGAFQVFCNIVCPVHPSMQNGKLIVGS